MGQNFLQVQQKSRCAGLWKQAVEKRKEFGEKMAGKPYDLAAGEIYLEHTDTVPLIRFRAFQDIPFVNAAFSTRIGGVSEGFFSELNLGFGRGDSEENVRKNYERFCESMGVPATCLVLSDQVHGTEIYTAERKDVCGEVVRKKLTGIDGLVTKEPGVCLATSYADCVPLFFVDKEKKVVAASHSGWRGTVEKIGKKTVERMESEFSSDRKDIVAVIGPSICQNCYEVGKEVADAFLENYSGEQMEEIMYPSEKEKEKYQLDLWAANFFQLRDAGLLPEQIHVAGLCTCCNSKLLFSHRASGGKRGNLNGFLSMTDDFFV